MNHRCINDLFGYCYNSPVPVDRKPPVDFKNSDGNVIYCYQYVSECVNDPETCSQYRTWTQECQRMGLLAV